MRLLSFSSGRLPSFLFLSGGKYARVSSTSKRALTLAFLPRRTATASSALSPFFPSPKPTSKSPKSSPVSSASSVSPRRVTGRCSVRSDLLSLLLKAVLTSNPPADVQMTIMQNLQYTEHLAEPMAELITVFSKEFDNDALGEKVLGCVDSSSSPFLALASSAAEAIAFETPRITDLVLPRQRDR